MKGHQVKTSFNIKTKTLVKAFCEDCKQSLHSWTEVKEHMGAFMWEMFWKYLPNQEEK